VKISAARVTGILVASFWCSFSITYRFGLLEVIRMGTSDRIGSEIRYQYLTITLVEKMIALLSCLLFLVHYCPNLVIFFEQIFYFTFLARGLNLFVWLLLSNFGVTASAAFRWGVLLVELLSVLAWEHGGLFVWLLDSLKFCGWIQILGSIYRSNLFFFARLSKCGV
jgi:hypothetical protein